ncbi:MAG: hypothetical protein ACYTHN_17625 [Planctomycetota bacterium]|jgi:hypothetical protein
MPYRSVILLLLWVFPGFLWAGEEDPPPGGETSIQQEIERWIGRLGSSDWEERKKATEALLRIGKPALPALEMAAESGDLEIRLRAKDILWQIRRGMGGGFFSPRYGAHATLLQNGGSPKTEAAVQRGLAWLRDHQNPDGTWSCKQFMKNCKQGACTGAGSSPTYDLAVTGLAVLAFLGAGHTYKHGKFKATMKLALSALKARQDEKGLFGAKTKDGRWIYNHLLCTFAVAEAYGMSGKSGFIHAFAQKAVDYLADCQTYDNQTNTGYGWRYGRMPDDGDSSCTAWAVMALKAARWSELHVPESRFEGALRWFEKVTDKEDFKVAYAEGGSAPSRPPGTEGKFLPTGAMTAAAVLARIFIHEAKAKERKEVMGGGKHLLRQLPLWDPDGGTIDMMFWFWGTQACFQLGGEAWAAWNDSIKKALLPSQHREGCMSGSWDPIGAWGGVGGRVYATAINLLTLEVYYRYRRFLK